MNISKEDILSRTIKVIAKELDRNPQGNDNLAELGAVIPLIF